MRIYNRLFEAYRETERELVEMGTIVTVQSMQDQAAEFETKELQGYSYAIIDTRYLDDDFKSLGGNKLYADLELCDRLEPELLNPGNAYLTRKAIWKPFLHNGRFSYTYNERFRDQLPRIIDELEEKPNTRQAIITIYDKHHDLANLGGTARIPCSMYYQFLRRTRNGKEELDILYTMRSCDWYTHALYDIYLAMKLQQHIAAELNIQPGNFTHFIGSLHIYKKDYGTRGVF